MVEIFVILLILIFPLGIAYGAVQSSFKTVGGLPFRKSLLLSAMVLSSLALPVLVTSQLNINNPYGLVIFFVFCLIGCVLLSGYLIKAMINSEFSFKNALIIYWSIFWRFALTWMILGAIIRIAKLIITRV